MRRTSIAVVILVLLAMAVASCGGGPPTKMTTYEASAFTIEYPEGWQEEGMDFMGMTMVILSEEEMSLEDFDMEQPPDSGLVALMYTPSGDAEFGLEDLDEQITEDEDVSITSRGDMTVGGREGRYVKAVGQLEEGGDEFAILMVVAEDGDNTFVLMGMSPERTWGKNEKIFDYMVESVKFE